MLFGIKMLLDARRAARTTLFTLEQEQASERAFRAVLVMAVATVFIAAVAGINNFVAPAIPPPVTDEPAPTVAIEATRSGVVLCRRDAGGQCLRGLVLRYTRLAARSGVIAYVPPGQDYGGMPAKPLREYARELAAIKMLVKKGAKKS